MRSTIVLALAAVATAVQIQSNNPAFPSNAPGCIAASSNADGAPVVIQPCLNFQGDFSPQNWTLTQNFGAAQPLNIFGNKCLDVTNGNNMDGTKLQIFTCFAGNTNQLWIPLGDSTFQWAGTNKCIDLTNGITTNGNQLQIFTCNANNPNQQWRVTAAPPASGSNRLAATRGPNTPQSCITASANTDNARVSLDACGLPTGTFAGGSDAWVLPAPGTTGPISTFDGTKCLDVTNGDSTNGNLLQVFTCVAGNTNQMFQIMGSGTMLMISWVGHNKCADVRDGNFTPGTANLQIWDCISNNDNQMFSIQ